MRLNRVVFLAETEYHLMVSVNIALSIFNTEEYFNDIYFWVSDTRLNYEINQIPELRGQLIPLNRNNRVNEIIRIKGLKPFRFYFFREGDVLLKYLAFEYKKGGAIICLAPDGYKPYGIFNKKHEFLSMIMDTWISYLLLFRNRLFIPRIIMSWNYRYGSLSFLDEIYLQEPLLFDAVRNRTRGVLKRLPEWDEQTVKLFSRIFGFNNAQLKQTSGIIFYINQPFWSEELVEKEIEILKEISNIFPERNILIKLHPTTSRFTISRYAEVERVNIIQDNRPAELYISQLENCIIFSGWSTALIFHKKQNHYYYTYPIFRSVKDKILDQINIVCFPHIRMITSVKEMLVTELK